MKYKHYTKTIRVSGIARAIRNRLYKQLVGVPRKVLEFGVGHGYFRDYCAINGIKYKGIDFCPELVFDGVIYAEIPAEMNRVPSGFDMIFAEHFIEHMRNYDTVVEFLEGCRSRLNKDGKLILLYPNMNKHFWHDPTHQYPTNKHRIEKCLIDAGFVVSKSNDYAHCFIGAIKTFPLRVVGWFMPTGARMSLHFCIHSYTMATREITGG